MRYYLRGEVVLMWLFSAAVDQPQQHWTASAVVNVAGAVYQLPPRELYANERPRVTDDH